MSKKHVVYFNMGPWDIAWFGFTQNPKAFAKELKRLGIDEPCEFVARSDAGATMHHFTSQNEGAPNVYIIALPKKENASDIQIAALIAHEAVHVKQFFFRSIGEENIGDETEAYFVQYLVQNILGVIEENKTRKELL